MEQEYQEDAGDYQIKAYLKDNGLRFRILDKSDGAEVVTGGVALDESHRRDEIILLVKTTLRKFAALNP